MEKDFDTDHFKVVSEADKYKKSTKMAHYAKKSFKIYEKDADIKQQLLLKNPVPDSLTQAKKPDEFVRAFLKRNINKIMWIKT